MNSILINAPTARAWDTLVNPEQTRKYRFKCEPISEWTPVSRMDWRGAGDGEIYVTGSVLKHDP